MAAFSHNRVGSRSSLFNGGGYGEVEQPNGSCNYRDLSFGTKAPVCGCQRFYMNSGHLHRQGQDTGLDGAWCFCGHHACFHNAFSEQQRGQEQAVTMSRMDGNEDIGYTEAVYHAGQQASSSPLAPAKAPAGLGIRPGSRSESQSINTRVWQALNDFARNQEDGGVSDTTSKLPSTAAPSVVEETRLSPNRMIHERLQQFRSMGPPVHIPQPSIPRPAEDYSATEVATPSIAGTPDFRALASSSNQATTSPGHLRPSRLEDGGPVADTNAQPAGTQPMPLGRAEGERDAPVNQTSSLRDLEDMIRTYGQRLEVLESLSFSHVPIEEIQDRFDLFDGRILDLEQWRTDEENQRTSPAPKKATSSKRRRLLPDDEGSFGSDASFDSNAAVHAEAAVLATLAANAETHPRIDALENRVTDLENAALPSFTRPWQVQVVFLPWGRELKGVWFSSTEATQHSLRSATQASEEWSGAQSAPKLSFKSSVNGAWTTESIEAWASEAQEWLSPKACGPTGMVFQRLASCGLVRDITLTAADARHILDALSDAFGMILTDDNELGTESAARYQGLRESFIPLRKVRKSSRLRFLSPAEMVTSATWTAAFLDSSAFMKVNDGQKRLYVTTPEAYVQPSDDGLSWNMIRELPASDPNGEEQVAQVHSVAVEACWTYNENLDQPLSVHSSFAFQASQGSMRSQMVDPDTEEIVQPPISPRSEARLPRQRTVSFPSSTSATGLVKETGPKRRVASFEPVTTLPIDAYGEGTETVSKRRRISKSPEAEPRGVNFTPRWSREPPSPYTSEPAAEARSQGTSSRTRGTTPFAYATPHSNSNFVGRIEFMTGDGDTEADTEVLADHSDRGEEEWEGVDDGNTNVEGQESHHGSVDDEAKINNDDLDDNI